MSRLTRILAKERSERTLRDWIHLYPDSVTALNSAIGRSERGVATLWERGPIPWDLLYEIQAELSGGILGDEPPTLLELAIAFERQFDQGREDA